MKFQDRKKVVMAVRKNKGLTTKLDENTLEFIFNASDEEFEIELGKLIDFKGV